MITERLEQEIDAVLLLATVQVGISMTSDQKTYLRRLIREVGLFAFAEGKARSGLADVVRMIPKREYVPTIGADEFPTVGA
jgi:hypothetical protein